jgi:predicted lipoprotein with Yx(FWY)xxD motif
MVKTTRRMGWLVGLVVLLAACSPSASPTDGGESGAPSSAPSEAGESSAPSEAAGAGLSVVETSAGSALAGPDGMTLYINTEEADGTIVCVDECEANWPVLEAPVEAGDADAALLGEVTRPDGTVQVTYNGFPLYYFAGDAAEGDATGEGLNGVWFIADPAGN